MFVILISQLIEQNGFKIMWQERNGKNDVYDTNQLTQLTWLYSCPYLDPYYSFLSLPFFLLSLSLPPSHSLSLFLPFFISLSLSYSLSLFPFSFVFFLFISLSNFSFTFLYFSLPLSLSLSLFPLPLSLSLSLFILSPPRTFYISHFIPPSFLLSLLHTLTHTHTLYVL